MSRKKKYHYIYKTTCDITNRFYYGMHSTNNLEDGYVGSGTRLWYSINKHGKENHSIEILEYYDNRNLLKSREKELVNEDMLKDPMCMNLKPGGYGGFNNEAHRKKCSNAGNIAYANKVQNDPELKKHLADKRNATNKRFRDEGLWKAPDWTGRSHREETKKKISESSNNKGSNNSQFGTCWIYNLNLKESKKISKIELETYLDSGWIKGRKLKF